MAVVRSCRDLDFLEVNSFREICSGCIRCASLTTKSTAWVLVVSGIMMREGFSVLIAFCSLVD